MKAAFLDRDGTIIKDYPDETWAEICEPEFLAGSIEGLRRLNEMGYAIVIVTNQYLIHKRIITVKQYEEVHQKMMAVLQKEGIHILDVFMCPHTKEENCACMKPKPGMIKEALKRYPEIELSQSFICGDSECDRLLAECLMMPFFQIDEKKQAKNERKGKEVFMSLADVAQNISQNDRNYT